MRFQDWASMRYHLLHAYEAPISPSARSAHEVTEWHSCWLLRQGAVVLTTEGKSLTVRAGEWAFVAMPSRHQAFSEDAEILSVRFDLTWPGGQPVLPIRENLSVAAADFPELEKAAKALVRQVRRSFIEASPRSFLPGQNCRLDQYLAVQNLMPQWLTAFLETQAALGNSPPRLQIQDDRIREAVADLDRFPLHQPFPWKHLLKRAGLQRSQFDARFTQMLGLPPKRYWEQRRRREAIELLTNSQTPIKEIAFELGFHHASHFSLWFKRVQGMSASEYRATRLS